MVQTNIGSKQEKRQIWWNSRRIYPPISPSFFPSLPPSLSITGRNPSQQQNSICMLMREKGATSKHHTSSPSQATLFCTDCVTWRAILLHCFSDAASVMTIFLGNFKVQRLASHIIQYSSTATLLTLELRGSGLDWPSSPQPSLMAPAVYLLQWKMGNTWRTGRHVLKGWGARCGGKAQNAACW